jgi:hypothetical protein
MSQSATYHQTFVVVSMELRIQQILVLCRHEEIELGKEPSVALCQNVCCYPFVSVLISSDASSGESSIDFSELATSLPTFRPLQLTLWFETAQFLPLPIQFVSASAQSKNTAVSIASFGPVANPERNWNP